jgi:hypothetical protein
MGPDVVGLATALAKLPGLTPEQRSLYRLSANTGRWVVLADL